MAAAETLAISQRMTPKTVPQSWALGTVLPVTWIRSKDCSSAWQRSTRLDVLTNPRGIAVIQFFVEVSREQLGRILASHIKSPTPGRVIDFAAPS